MWLLCPCLGLWGGLPMLMGAQSPGSGGPTALAQPPSACPAVSGPLQPSEVGALAIIWLFLCVCVRAEPGFAPRAGWPVVCTQYVEEILKKWGSCLERGVLLAQDSRSPRAGEREVFCLA